MKKSIFCAVYILLYNYLNYNSIAKTPWVNHPLTGQHIGIFFIEIGVGLTVSSIMCLIYLVLKED